jgi:RHS repeat-associated protein
LGLANVTSGTNTVAVVAHDVEGNTSTNNYQVVIPPASAAYTYDLNGNLMTDATRTYAWNAKNELVSIVYTSGPNAGTHTEFTYNGAGDRVKIVERSGTVIGSGTITSTKQYAGNEELDGTGTVTKRYFAQGEQRIVSGVTTNYFYTRDHLGSIREMIASDGATIDARYSYDPYGRATQVSGSLSCDFQYAGMYEHATSGLNLTQYRAYDPNVGRWLSRDPIGESGGIDLYGYVGNSPTNAIDPFGLLAYVLSLSLSAEAGIMGAGTGGSSAWGLGISFDSWNGIPYPSDFGIVNTVAKQTAYTGGGYGIGITFLGSQANNLSEMQTKCPSDAVPTLDLDFGGMHFGKDMSVSADAELGGQTIGGAGLSNVTTNVYSIAAALNWLGNAISNPLYLTHP